MISLATAVILVRGLHLAATLSLLGVIGYIAWVLPAAAVNDSSLMDLLTRFWQLGGLTALLYDSRKSMII